MRFRQHLSQSGGRQHLAVIWRWNHIGSEDGQLSLEAGEATLRAAWRGSLDRGSEFCAMWTGEPMRCLTLSQFSSRRYQSLHRPLGPRRARERRGGNFPHHQLWYERSAGASGAPRNRATLSRRHAEASRCAVLEPRRKNRPRHGPATTRPAARRHVARHGDGGSSLLIAIAEGVRLVDRGTSGPHERRWTVQALQRALHDVIPSLLDSFFRDASVTISLSKERHTAPCGDPVLQVRGLLGRWWRRCWHRFVTTARDRWVAGPRPHVARWQVRAHDAHSPHQSPRGHRAAGMDRPPSDP